MVEQVTRKEFAEAVGGAISGVQHLYREVDRLIAALRDALAQEPEPLAIVRGTLGKSGRDPTRVVIRNEYGVLFEPLSDEEDLDPEDKVDDGEDEGDEPDEADGAEDRRRRKLPVELATDQAFLAVRVALAQAQPSDEFEPQVQFAILGDWGLGPTGIKPREGQSLLVRRSVLRKIPRVLGSKADFTRRILTAAKVIGKGIKSSDRRLSCRLMAGVHSMPLYEVDDAAKLDQLAASIKNHWTNAVGEHTDVAK